MKLFYFIPVFAVLFMGAAVFNKTTITIPSRTYPVGTTLSPLFVVPAKNVGIYTVSIPCQPTIAFSMKLVDTTNNRSLGSFKYGAMSSCPGGKPILASWDSGVIPEKAQLQLELIANVVMTTTITITFLETP